MAQRFAVNARVLDDFLARLAPSLPARSELADSWITAPIRVRGDRAAAAHLEAKLEPAASADRLGRTGVDEHERHDYFGPSIFFAVNLPALFFEPGSCEYCFASVLKLAPPLMARNTPSLPP